MTITASKPAAQGDKGTRWSRCRGECRAHALSSLKTGRFAEACSLAGHHLSGFSADPAVSPLADEGGITFPRFLN